MMQLKLYYSDFANFGDALNRLLIEKLSGTSVCPSSPFDGELMAVGSIFYGGGFFWGPKGVLCSRDRMRFYYRRLKNLFRTPMNVWGSGLLLDLPTPLDVVIYRKMNIAAVRGCETVRVLRRAGFLSNGKMPTLGDPGLFYPDLIPECYSAPKRYDLALVPHYTDYKIGLALGEKLSTQGFVVKVVDVMQSDPLNVIREIASAGKVLSASLHGLIVSDSLGIPNRHLVLSDYEVDRHFEKGAFMFKFRDYYSAFGMDNHEWVSGPDVDSHAKEILKGITAPLVKSKVLRSVKCGLLEAFPVQYRGNDFDAFKENVASRG